MFVIINKGFRKYIVELVIGYRDNWLILSFWFLL